jgi:hypothetical protein
MATQMLTRVEETVSLDTDTMYLMGGVALMLVGASMVLSNPSVRRYLSQIKLGDFAAASLPDVERYFRLRSM